MGDWRHGGFFHFDVKSVKLWHHFICGFAAEINDRIFTCGKQLKNKTKKTDPVRRLNILWFQVAGPKFGITNVSSVTSMTGVRNIPVIHRLWFSSHTHYSNFWVTFVFKTLVLRRLQSRTGLSSVLINWFWHRRGKPHRNEETSSIHRNKSKKLILPVVRFRAEQLPLLEQFKTIF